VFTALLGTILPVTAHADQVWRIVTEKSHFGPGTNIVAMERSSGQPAGGEGKAASTPLAAQFLVIANDKVYLAVDERAYASISGIRAVDYRRWRDMKLIKIGDNLRRDYCGSRCQRGLPEDRMNVTFTSNGVDPRLFVRNMPVLNDK